VQRDCYKIEYARPQPKPLRPMGAVGAQNFETLQWSAKNHGRRQKLAKYTIAYGTRGLRSAKMN
jgi:hypothetical protein